MRDCEGKSASEEVWRRQEVLRLTSICQDLKRHGAWMEILGQDLSVAARVRRGECEGKSAKWRVRREECEGDGAKHHRLREHAAKTSMSVVDQ